MKIIPDKCDYDPETITCLEASGIDLDDPEKVNAHVQNCRDCSKNILQNQMLSDLVRQEIENESSKVDFHAISEPVIEYIRKSNNRLSVWEMLNAHKKIYFPLASTLVLLFILTYVFLFESSAKSFPSAIVDSISGQVTSVMIMETQQTRKTVIWFNETS